MLFFFNKLNEELLTANSYLQNCLPCQRNILSWEIKTHTTNQQNATNSPYSFCRGMRLRLVWCFQTSLMKTCWNLQLLPIECCSLSRGCVFLTASFAFKLATMELCDQLTTIQKEAWLYEGRNYNTWQTANSLSRSWSTAVQEAELVLAPPVTSSCWAVTLELVILNILLLFSVTLPMFSRKFSLGGLLALTLLGDKTASASSLSTIISGKWQLHCLTLRVVTSLSSNLYSYLSSREGSRQETWPYSSCTQLLSGVWYQCSSNKPKNWQRC